MQLVGGDLENADVAPQVFEKTSVGGARWTLGGANAEQPRDRAPVVPELLVAGELRLEEVGGVDHEASRLGDVGELRLSTQPLNHKPRDVDVWLLGHALVVEDEGHAGEVLRPS